MKGSDIFLSLFIFIVFLGLYLYNIFVVEYTNIMDNWPEYRCNPIVMPFASNFGVDSSENFTYCIQNMTTGFVDYLLEPVTYSLTLFNTLGEQFTEAIDSIRSMISQIRDFISEIIQSVFGVFLNIIIEFQKILISLKDTVAKTIGIITTLLYTMDGTMKTMESAWGSPAGDTMKALCFHPDTHIQLQSDKIKLMRNLDLGDVLSNGSIIVATMQLKNFMGDNKHCEKYWKTKDSPTDTYSQIEPLYMMRKQNHSPVYVTGLHLVQTFNNEWVFAKDHPDAKLCSKKTKWLSCIITDDHLVPINGYMFHDWEDENGKPSKDLSIGCHKE